MVALPPDTSDNTSDRGNGVKLLTHLGSIVIIILLAVVLFRKMQGVQLANLSFTGFLQTIQGVPVLDFSSFSGGINTALDWLRYIPILGDLLGVCLDIISIIVWIFQGIAQVVLYALYLIQSFFVVA